MQLCVTCGSPAPGYVDRCPRCNSWLTERRDRLVGSLLVEKYRIEERLGSGGMCSVYRARHVLIGKEVAIKFLKPELAANPKIVWRFKQEALAASRVRHPNAIDVTDYGVDQQNTPFIVMELVRGETLADILRRDGPLTVERAANIMRQICGALEAAHEVGVIHRDIKPENILIAEHDGSDWVEVTDFGVAKIQEDLNRTAPPTEKNFIIGTPRYMSPEQCEDGRVDPRSDIYSLGVVLYEMLAGETPFQGNSTRLLIAHSKEPPAPLGLKRPDIPPGVEAVVMRSLEKDPALRPQSAAEFYGEFAAAAGLDQGQDAADTGGAFSRLVVPVREGQPLEGSPVEDEPTLVRGRSRYATPARPSPSRRRILVLAGALVLIAAIAVTAYLALRDRSPGGAPPGERTTSEGVASTESAPESQGQAAKPEVEAAAPPQTGPPAGDLAEARSQVEASIYRWASALEERDLRAHMESYAPNLDRFYLKRGVSRSEVRADRARALSIYSDLKFRFSNMRIDIDRSGRRAVATFDKEWDFKGAKSSSGSVREVVWLEKSGDRWRITGERDLKVHYARSG